MNCLELQDSEENLMAQLFDGLQDQIARKVERQNYKHFHDLLHLAIQAQQHIKRKTLSTSRRKSTWTPPEQRNNDKGKCIEVENRFKKTAAPKSSKSKKKLIKESPLMHLETETLLVTSVKGKTIMLMTAQTRES